VTKNYFLIVLFIATCYLTAQAEKVNKAKPTHWKGFAIEHLTVSGKQCTLHKPKKAAPGNPWVWRARWPNYHKEVDLLLLKDGYHIAYMGMEGLLGAPKFMPLWESFYETMTQKYKLNKKAAHYTVSRGGLYTYRWARIYPETVACIYADTPVLDFKSWPGGKGKGVGSPGQWRGLLKHYRFASEEEAMTYRDNPIDNFQAIIDAKIPLLHLVIENDQVVPPVENTYLFKKNLEKNGGHVDIISIPTGTVKSKGHHCILTDPEEGASFIRKHTQLN
jgi:sialidase-1